jgi:hypothetical protein
MHASAGPSSSKASSKVKVSWKSGPPSCKECVRLKLKVRDNRNQQHIRRVESVEMLLTKSAHGLGPAQAVFDVVAERYVLQVP